MATFNETAYLNGATKRANSYVAKLKHGASFKYVKGFSKVEKTLLSIMLERQNNGSFLELTNQEMDAFGMKASNGNGMVFAIDVTATTGKLNIRPIRTL